MKKCPKLWEYSYLIDAIRRNMSDGKKIDAAVDQAVQHCIEQGILTDILAKNRTEVTNMILEEYDAEFHIQCEKELSREEGRSKNLIALVTRKLARGKSPSEIADDLEEDLSVIQMICEAARDFAPGYDCDQIYQKLVDLRAAIAK